MLFYHYIHALVEAEHDVLGIVIAAHGADTKALAEYQQPLASIGRFQLLCLQGDRSLIPEKWGVITRFDQFPSLPFSVEQFKPDVILAFDVAMAGLVAPKNCLL